MCLILLFIITCVKSYFHIATGIKCPICISVLKSHMTHLSRRTVVRVLAFTFLEEVALASACKPLPTSAELCTRVENVGAVNKNYFPSASFVSIRLLLSVCSVDFGLLPCHLTGLRWWSELLTSNKQPLVQPYRRFYSYHRCLLSCHISHLCQFRQYKTSCWNLSQGCWVGCKTKDIVVVWCSAPVSPDDLSVWSGERHAVFAFGSHVTLFIW